MFKQEGTRRARAPAEDAPPPGFDGYVRISPGTFSRNIDKQIPNAEGGFTSTRRTETMNRSATIFHELDESYYRTTKGLPYMRKDGSGAHQNAVKDEGNTYGHSQPVSNFKQQ